jgi:prepilin-type N-terminal cleavage/methylation domain-containing protein
MYVAPVPHRRRAAYTLLELIVVLVLMGLAAAIVLPMLRARGPSDSAMQAIVTSAREAAAKRGEIVYVRFEPTGEWHMEGGGSTLEGDFMGGRIRAIAQVPLTLIVSPTGSCAFDVRSAALGAGNIPLDPLTCQIDRPRR